MSIVLPAPGVVTARPGGPEYWESLTEATRALETPLGAISLQALAFNADSMAQRAAGTRIRVASKSIRVRSVIDAVLARPGFGGVLAYTLPEALWLAESVNDVVVGYPSVDRDALRALATSAELASRVTIMVDSIEHLDLVDAVLPPSRRETVRVCLELDASWNSRLLGHIGTWRSPVHSVDDARALAETIAARPGFALVGMMAYEGQIAGLVNAPANALRGIAVRWIQGRSAAELAERRARAVQAVRQVAELEFVNGGGTGSLESTSAESSVTEIAAGSGLFGPHLFDHYRHFSPAPAAAFALSVVRRPDAGKATLLGGGWVASGPAASDRLPLPVWPEGLRMIPREMAGEVQTPLTGAAAARLRTGDRVWLRHTKAGELSEHLNGFAIVDGRAVVGEAPTYRGEGKAFL
ncbi:D-serine deaminase-like pyridoxal phosphate-dependent protein [Homoserinimonas aerilata]|uniref:D-serine deaminase-like pyridoxal phosphate-dependent protein n=1 Tax=Homoserinimonas aerilata TaxID=1162970 RepID=A0A542YGQ0_9MICO|nr:alanine racemase [Homoserinimonas aerilata]TQL47272.1 D-serine deaminase-like pyridoxal phosphate-dependent protein [Homoserinimonas aerilata]